MFDLDDPWHRYLHLSFAIHCNCCHADYGVSNASAAELAGDFLALCELLAARAQSMGWRMVDEWSFRCPACVGSPDADPSAAPDIASM